MAKNKDIEWIVSGTAKLRGVKATVHAETHQEAVRKANCGGFIGGIDLDVGELVDFEFDLAEANSE